MRIYYLAIVLSIVCTLNGCAGRSVPWFGSGCDCASVPDRIPPYGHVAERCDAAVHGFHNVITAGDNVLVIDFVYVYDNAEGVKPDGLGTNWGWMGPIPWKHGPVGNLHIRLYDDDGIELRHLRNLPGPARTLPRFEWKDNQCMAYQNFGIWDWDWTTDSAVTVRIYESDPGPWREHDTLIRARVRRSEFACVDSTYFIPRIELRTTTLPEVVLTRIEN